MDTGLQEKHVFLLHFEMHPHIFPSFFLTAYMRENLEEAVTCQKKKPSVCAFKEQVLAVKLAHT